MTKSLLLNVGTADGKPVHFNLKKLKRSHLLITGASGSGKSYFERVIAEQIVGRVQTFIIDPEGEYVTLREKFPFLLVGEGGEVPIHPKTAGVLAQRLMNLGVSAIFDLSSMEVADQHLWVKNFVHALMQMKPKDTHDLVILVDESHLFCPEKGESESVAKPDMLDLASRGRKRGYTNIWATQRLAKLANNAASELQNTCIGRVFLVDDREKAARILGIPKRSKLRDEFYASLKVLDQGIFFAQGVAVSADLITFHVSEAQTRHPDPGERSSRRIVVPTPAQIKKLVPELASIPVEAEEKEKTEKELRSLIRELKTELAQAKKSQPKTTGAVDPAQLRELRTKISSLHRRYSELKKLAEELMKIAAQVTAKGFENLSIKPEDIEAVLKPIAVQIGKLVEKKIQARAAEVESLKKGITRVQRQLSALLESDKEGIDVRVDVQHNEPFTVKPSTPRNPAQRKRTSLGDENGVGSIDLDQAGITRYEGDLVKAMAMIQRIGREKVPVEMVAAMAKKSMTSSSFSQGLRKLESLGIFSFPEKGFVSFTEKGQSIAPEADPPESPEAMLAQCKGLVGSYNADMLDVLFKKYPEAVSREDLSQGSGNSATSSSFDKGLRYLRDAGMVELTPQKGPVATAKLESWVMLEE